MMRGGFVSSTVAKALSVVVLGAVPVAVYSHAHAHVPPAGTWTLAYDHPLSGKYEDFAFPDTIHGWLVSSRGEILNTNDGGRTWAVQTTGLPGLRSVDFIDRNRGFAGTLVGTFHATTDGGAHWTDITAT